MISFDTNILIYARVTGSPWHEQSAQFFRNLETRADVAVAELVLVEFYLALRNPVILTPALDSSAAAAQCDILRKHPHWKLVENAHIMASVWQYAAHPGFSRRRIIDVRLALTLQAHGVTDFATANTQDFSNLGFRRVWNPLKI